MRTLITISSKYQRLYLFNLILFNSYLIIHECCTFNKGNQLCEVYCITKYAIHTTTIIQRNPQSFIAVLLTYTIIYKNSRRGCNHFLRYCKLYYKKKSNEGELNHLFVLSTRSSY